ncbi:NADH dehydrogenase subunit N [Sulfitobacter brevis]|uniref:NADH-quinone oxidoreductase subunit N n=1 Tax=Sulfitobacter brevis TaxID=74348 RepID=A0A1I2G7Q7_9RHOB|nr:NADH-quinone oxidoreductase subunit N [Sulfitobacter brevis]SFF13189.1 NADH dehydrogenase subunit N [Sulfitobacter brevis]
MPIGDVAPEISIIVAAVLALLFAAFAPRRMQAGSALIALAGIAIAVALLLAQLGETRFTFSGTWALDGASLWARLMILISTAFCILLSPGWFRTDPRHGEYYTILLLGALGAMAMAGAGDLLQLVIAVLLSSVTGYTLAAWHRDWALSVEAGMKYFLMGALANALLITGVTLILGLLSSSEYADIATALKLGNGLSPLLFVGFALTITGVAFKLGAVPAHAWLPDVAEGAPVPSAAFLTVVPKIGAAIALARLVQLVPPEFLGLRPLIAVLAVATMTLGNLAALWQDDLRRLIGWSSVAQAGYLLMAITVLGLSPDALTALLVFVASYAIGNLTAFAVVAHLRGRTALNDYDGLAKRRPVAAAALVIAFLSLVGIPPTVGFLGKLTLFIATIDGGYTWLAVVAAANTVASLFYYARVMGRVYFGVPPENVAVMGRLSCSAMWIAAITVIVSSVLVETAIVAFGLSQLLPI